MPPRRQFCFEVNPCRQKVYYFLKWFILIEPEDWFFGEVEECHLVIPNRIPNDAQKTLQPCVIRDKMTSGAAHFI